MRKIIAGSLLVALSVFVGLAAAQAALPMGSVEDVRYATQLWRAMEAERLIGEKSIHAEPFRGAAKPHGWVLELHHMDLRVGSHTGFVVVKKNYDEGKPSIEQVKANRDKYLSSITVMYQREKGYDMANQDWFWVKYKPNGELFTKDTGSQSLGMAGRIMKGPTWESSGGCIYCHASAGGGDYIFYPEIVNPNLPR